MSGWKNYPNMSWTLTRDLASKSHLTLGLLIDNVKKNNKGIHLNEEILSFTSIWNHLKSSTLMIATKAWLKRKINSEGFNGPKIKYLINA